MASSETKTATLRVRRKGTQESVIVHGASVVSGVYRTLPNRSTRDLLQAYSVSPLLQAINRKIAGTMAKIEWKAIVRSPDGESIEVPNHIMARMLNGGVPGLDGYQCKMSEQLGYELAGECFLLLERNFMGVPYRRWPIPANWVKNTPSPVQEVFEIQNPNGGPPTWVNRTEMLWIKDVDPLQPYRRGVGVARALSDELNADEAAAKHMGSILVNRARPDIIISGTKEMPIARDQAEKLYTVWQQRFGGPDNAGKPFVSLSPIQVDQLTPSFRELQLKDLRQFERDFMITVYGIPPEVMGVIENANRATIDTAEFLFMKHVIEPRAEARRSAYNDQLAWQYDERLEVDYDDLVAEDKEFNLKVMQAKPNAFSKDEYRELAEHEPLPDGMGEFKEEPEPEPEATDLVPPVAPEEDQPSALSAPPSQAERGWSSDRTKIFEQDIDEIIDAMDERVVTEVLRRGTRATVAEFATDALESLGVEIAFDIGHPRVEEFLSDVAGVRSNLINGTTRKQLRTVLTEGVRSGDTQAGLISRVRSVVRDAGAVRADTIARTEVVRASNFAAEEAFLQVGVTEKEWLAVQDDRTRDSHAEMDGQKVPVSSVFTSPDGFTAEYPGDFGIASEDINCRCSVIAVDSASEKTVRVERFKGIEQNRGRLENSLRRDVEQAFEQQGDQVIARIKGE